METKHFCNCVWKCRFIVERRNQTRSENGLFRSLETSYSRRTDRVLKRRHTRGLRTHFERSPRKSCSRRCCCMVDGNEIDFETKRIHEIRNWNFSKDHSRKGASFYSFQNMHLGNQHGTDGMHAGDRFRRRRRCFQIQTHGEEVCFETDLRSQRYRYNKTIKKKRRTHRYADVEKLLTALVVRMSDEELKGCFAGHCDAPCPWGRRSHVRCS